MPKVLFIGDINVDVMMGGMQSLPMVDREVICQSYEVVMGASTVICACAYASLGGQASMAGLAGNDDYGEFMVKGLQGFGVNTGLVRRTDRVRTGVTVNMIYQSTRTQVTYPGTIAEFDGSELDESIFAGVDHVHFAGVYIQTKLRPEITRLLKLAGNMGVTTSVDPQWDSSEKWEGMEEWLPLLTYLFVNKDEAISIARAASAEEAYLKLAAKTRCPILKTGEEGALVPVDGVLKAIPAVKVQVVDTTGAGDCFDAGFLYATLEKKMGFAQACQFAIGAASRSCTFVGGLSARSTYEDVLKFLAERTPGTTTLL
jgi:sugar/nucleoside kinase (ribokinase family)